MNMKMFKRMNMKKDAPKMGEEVTKVEAIEEDGVKGKTIEINGVDPEVGEMIEEIVACTKHMYEVNSIKELVKLTFFLYGELYGMQRAGMINEDTESALGEMVSTIANNAKEELMGEKDDEEDNQTCEENETRYNKESSKSKFESYAERG